MPVRGQVPNVPCGVERKEAFRLLQGDWTVPNVPCGVERCLTFLLMADSLSVPNVPCGVERVLRRASTKDEREFLMYRVELKEVRDSRMSWRPSGS